MLTLIHALHDAIEVRHRGDDGAEVALCRYVYAPRMPARESPKPYLHPLRTLAGRIVTAYRPHDHVWHKGLMLTSAQLSGQNFWGGPTFVRDQGYVQLDNNGRVEHREWAQLASEEQRATLDERLAWIAADGEEWLAEERTIAVAEVAADEGYWSLDFATRLRNLRATPLVFGSPTTEGRPLAGYGGLFWRGPRSFLGGQILAGDLEGPGVMGQPAPWLAFIGQHDEEDATSTLLFLDHPDNPRYPTKWFVRNDPFACASFAFSFDEEFILPPGATLEQRYRIVIADGEWPREQIAAYAARYPDAPSPRDRRGQG